MNLLGILRSEMLRKIRQNDSLIREKHPDIPHNADYVLFTSDPDIYETVLKDYKDIIYNIQFGRSYDSDGLAHYVITHLVLDKLQTVLRGFEEENYEIMLLFEDEMSFSE